MTSKTLISEIMTREIVTVGVDTPISEVRDILAKQKFHHLPVVDGTTLVGIISTRDLIRSTQNLSADALDRLHDSLDRSISTRETMQTELYTMRSDAPAEQAIDLLASGERHSILIVDKDEEALVGIVTNVDLLDFLFS